MEKMSEDYLKWLYGYADKAVKLYKLMDDTLGKENSEWHLKLAVAAAISDAINEYKEMKLYESL